MALDDEEASGMEEVQDKGNRKLFFGSDSRRRRRRRRRKATPAPTPCGSCTREICPDGRGRRKINGLCCQCGTRAPTIAPTAPPTTPPTAPPTAPTPAPSADDNSNGDGNGNSNGSDGSTTGATGTAAGSHFWDCNGGACDGTTLSPWDESKFVYAPQYAPVDPSGYPGGAAYGERLWATAAMSDALSDLMGADETDPHCGTVVEYDDDNTRREYPGGCGKCLLVTTADATNAGWSAVVMKKSRCPPESNGCEAGNAHLDLAVPGYDNLQYSTANVCGQRAGTLLTAAQSSVCGTWSASGAADTAAGCDCSSLPSGTAEERALKAGCELFTEWGWTTGAPTLQYEVVQCPAQFLNLVGNAFDAGGVVAMSARARALRALRGSRSAN